MADFDFDSLPEAKAQGFDFDSLPEASAKTPNKPLPTPMLESALRGAEQGATFGFSDELRGGLGAAKDVALDNYKLSDLVKRYQVNRDQARAMLEKAKVDNPGSYTAGEVAGSIGSSFIPGIGSLGAAKGATVAARALNAAKGGAILGGLTGLGTSNADLTKGDVSGAVNDTTSGAKTGAVIGGIMTPLTEGVASGIKKFIDPENLKDIAADRAVKATTGQNIGALRKIAGATPGGQDIGVTEAALRRSGRNLLDEGVISPFDSVEDLAPKLAAKRQEIGAQIGSLGSKVDEIAPGSVSGDNIAQQILDYADSIPKTESGKALQAKLQAEAENLKGMGNLSFADAQKLKNQFKYNPQQPDALISSQDATNKLRDLISKNMDQAVDSTANNAGISDADKALLGQYGDLKDKYRTFKGTSAAASDRVLKNISNRYVSPSDYGAGATGALAASLATGGTAIPTIALGAAAAGLNKLARERGNSTAAVGLQKAAEALENSPEFANKFGNILYQSAQRGGPSLALTHELLKKKFPDYERLLNENQGQ